MNAEVLFRAIQAGAVVVRLGFPVYEMRRYRKERNREAAMELLHAFQTPEFAKALLLLYRLPDGLSKPQIASSPGEDLHRVYAMTTTWESVGVPVSRGEVSMDPVDDFFSGAIVVSCRKLQSYIFDQRRETGRETAGEWLQWLAERFAEREGTTPSVPADLLYRDWRPR